MNLNFNSNNIHKLLCNMLLIDVNKNNNDVIRTVRSDPYFFLNFEFL